MIKQLFQKYFLLSFCLTGFSLAATAQRTCGTENSFIFQRLYPARYDSIEGRVKNFLAQQKSRPTGTLAVRSIPIVVHVLYNNNTTDPTYISDAKIISQINTLNQDFRRLNADWTNTPSAFQAATADCEVRFCLASKDPGGNSTSGIIRKYTDSINFFLKTSPKHNNTGGSDAWAANKYLNLWVVPRINNGSELLGYATFPWQNAGAEDGVVIRFNAFGSVAPVQTKYNLGRTSTHEIGHWLGLKHIWGDEPACAADDDVADTPPQADNNYGCQNFPLTDACSNGNGVMFMNYMDYTDDRCMFMFTAGQKARMYYYLINDHKTVVDNAGAGCGDCPYILIVSGNVSTNINYRSANEIISTQNILPGIFSNYSTGNKVTLSPGFHAGSGATVRIKTGEICYPPN